MPLVRATEHGQAQTESHPKGVGDVGVSSTRHCCRRSLLERSAAESDSLVADDRRVMGTHEYRLLDMRREDRGHQPLTLNTRGVR